MPWILYRSRALVGQYIHLPWTPSGLTHPVKSPIPRSAHKDMLESLVYRKTVREYGRICPNLQRSHTKNSPEGVLDKQVVLYFEMLKQDVGVACS
jgi:hypothetical protein